ncbi:MAG: hypothetical protein A2340_01555 [Lentisphaerae bacterium RIFOXYB12_FULL_60_10]|nr:MAG: hypothetical protein A2340_01555 [Lentisphaerae bacterium RIFOXYB12_FULL_60_10]
MNPLEQIETQKAAEALRVSEVRYRRLFETAKDGILILNVETGMVVDVNPFLVELLGFSHTSFLGKEIWELGFFKDIFANHEKFLELQKQGYVRYDNLPLETTDGRKIAVEFVSNVYQENGHKVIQCNIRDITIRKLAEKTLLESEKQLRLTLDAASAVAWVGEVDSDRLTEIGPVAKVFGKPAGFRHVNRSSFIQDIHPDDRARVIAAMHAGTDVYSVEFRVPLADGGVRWLQASGRFEQETENRGAYVRGITIDITERKRAEENWRKVNEELQTALQQLLRTQKQMVREERLSALGQMASGIAHDFNNVLVPIVGYSEMLLSKPETLSNRDDALSMITDIHTAAEDARRIVQRLGLIRGSEDEGRHVPVDIDEIARSAVELVRPRWDKEMGAKGNTINIVTLLGADKQTRGDASQLREALINLILNAVDAMPKGGTLTLSSRVENDNVVVEVLDEGTGMTDETKERCIEPFFTTKGSKGTGLGLSMVHGIVMRHKGTMEIDSILKKGTTIRIILPCASAEPVVKESKVEKTGKDFIVAPLRILVADDEEQSRMLVAMLLIRDGHTITMARTGREAIEKANAENFDLVITDRSMPEANGDLVALSVKARTPEIPVILLTGFGDIMKDKGECPPGVDRVLSKPLTQRDLQQAIAKVMGKCT